MRSPELEARIRRRLDALAATRNKGINYNGQIFKYAPKYARSRRRLEYIRQIRAQLQIRNLDLTLTVLQPRKPFVLSDL